MAEKMLMKGNEAIGEAAVIAGCRYYFGYPITPQSELIEYMAKRLPQVDWSENYGRKNTHEGQRSHWRSCGNCRLSVLFWLPDYPSI